MKIQTQKLERKNKSQLSTIRVHESKHYGQLFKQDLDSSLWVISLVSFELRLGLGMTKPWKPSK